MFHDVVQVVPDRNYTVYVYFDDGKIVRYNAMPLLGKKAFEPLKNPDFFMKACTVMNGTLAWDVSGRRDCRVCLDIDPETLYELEHIAETPQRDHGYAM